MNNYWLNMKKKVRLKLGSKPNVIFNIRPIKTIKGDIVEWQLMLSNGGLDYQSLASGDKPTPGNPVAGNYVVRFHPDDVE